MQNQLNNFYQTVEKKYLPNGQKDIYVGAKSLFNILDKEVEIKTCETIFIKAIAVLELNSETFTLEKLKEHLTASGAEMLFSEAQALHFHNLLQAVRRLAYDGSSLSQSVSDINQKDKASHSSPFSKLKEAVLAGDAQFKFKKNHDSLDVLIRYNIPFIYLPYWLVTNDYVWVLVGFFCAFKFSFIYIFIFLVPFLFRGISNALLDEFVRAHMTEGLLDALWSDKQIGIFLKKNLKDVSNRQPSDFEIIDPTMYPDWRLGLTKTYFS